MKNREWKYIIWQDGAGEGILGYGSTLEEAFKDSLEHYQVDWYYHKNRHSITLGDVVPYVNPHTDKGLVYCRVHFGRDNCGHR